MWTYKRKAYNAYFLVYYLKMYILRALFSRYIKIKSMIQNKDIPSINPRLSELWLYSIPKPLE